jgi:hypothetical protein
VVLSQVVPYKDKNELYKAQKRHRIKVRKNIQDFLSDKMCIDCGEKDPIVLEFDHKLQSDKFKTINKMLSGHYSWSTIEKEILKCEIRCANCHRRKTYKQLKNLNIKPL